jgi:DNA-binding GntR family transcriptional regulator
MARPKRPRISAEFQPLEPARRELWEHVAAGIRDAILSGAIPAGSSLVEADVADRFGVSRGPVRDAFKELARERLLVELPRRGTTVAVLSFADLQEVYAVREGLEIVASRLAIERASDDEIRQLGTAVSLLEEQSKQRVPYSESLAADLAFHRGLTALCGNARITSLYEQMLSQTQLHARTAAVTNPRLRLAMKRSAHRDILDALAARDVDRARRAITSHYRYAEERLYSGLHRARATPVVEISASGGPPRTATT